MYEIPDKAFRHAIRDIENWLDSDFVYHSVDKIFPLSEIANAHLYLQSGKASGNVIISVNDQILKKDSSNEDC